MADQVFAVNSGFYDAVNSDRTYSADDMNRPYKRVVSNGVFATPKGTKSTDLQVVSANNGMQIIVQKGEGIFADKWFENPAAINITVPANTSTVPRIDSVIVQVDKRTSGRVGNIVYRTGTPSVNPTAPSINTVSNVTEYRLANVRVETGTTAITTAMITDRRGSSDCPWVTSLIYQVDTSVLYDQWAAAYEEYFETEKEMWDNWYSHLTEELDVSMSLLPLKNTVVTTSETSEIDIGISDYNANTDLLEVYINGLRVVEGSQYTINGNTSILLLAPLSAGQTINFVCLKSVIGGSGSGGGGNAEFVTPEMFGAVGDGVTDDTAAINAAIAYATEKHLTLRFNPKTYGVIPATSVSNSYMCAFKIEHSITIDLNNATLKTLQNDVVFWAMFLICNYYTKDGQILIKNGTLIGDKDTGSTGSYYDSTQIITMDDSENVVLDNLKIINSKGDGIGFDGGQNGNPYPSRPFDDFYMGIFIRNCVIDGSNRNGFSISKCRGVYIEKCVIKNTTGVNPKLGVDLEPVYGSGNVFDVTFRDCVFENNTNGCIAGYTPDGLFIDNCTGDNSFYTRNCRNVRISNSKFTTIHTYGSDIFVSGCVTDEIVIEPPFATVEEERNHVFVNTTCNGRIVCRNSGGRYKNIIFDNCIFNLSSYWIDGSLASGNKQSEAFILRNNTIVSNMDSTIKPTGRLIDINGVTSKLIIENNDIDIKINSDGWGLIGDLHDNCPDYMSLVGNDISCKISDGVTSTVYTLFYRCSRSSGSSIVVFKGNVFNAENNAVKTSGSELTILRGTNSNISAYISENILRKISALATGDGNILSSSNNVYDSQS